MGENRTGLHHWAFRTRAIQHMFGMFDIQGGEAGVQGTQGVDDGFIARGFANVGAWFLGRHMFGPVRGPSPDLNWRG